MCKIKSFLKSQSVPGAVVSYFTASAAVGAASQLRTEVQMSGDSRVGDARRHSGSRLHEIILYIRHFDEHTAYQDGKPPLRPYFGTKLHCALRMTSRSTLLPEVLPNQRLSTHLRSQSELDSQPVCSFNNEPPLPGKTMDECNLSNSEMSQHCTQPLNKLDDHSCTKQCIPETPMCRICHEGSLQEELLTPCECLGTMATIHRSCLEHWLSASGTSFCELCHYQFTVQRKSRPLLEWLQNPGLRQEKRTLFGDMVCFLLITPLATISGWLCLRGAIDHLHFSSRLEAVGLIALTVALFTIYLFWTLVSLRYHCRLYNEWRLSNQRVVLLLPRSHSEPVLTSLNNSQRGKNLSKESIV